MSRSHNISRMQNSSRSAVLAFGRHGRRKPWRLPRGGLVEQYPPAVRGDAVAHPGNTPVVVHWYGRYPGGAAIDVLDEAACGELEFEPPDQLGVVGWIDGDHALAVAAYPQALHNLRPVTSR